MTSALVIADIVASRALPDRTGAQRAIEDAVERVERDRPLARRPLTATVGDEFQGEYGTLFDALHALLLLQLALPDGIELRFGIGIGDVTAVGSATDAISDGPGWWAARDAIDEAHRLQDHGVPTARTCVVGAPEEDAGMSALVALANAYLRVRDELLGGMSERARRLTYGRALGRTQRDLAQHEGITQPAVSQILSAAGAPALLTGLTALGGSAR